MSVDDFSRLAESEFVKVLGETPCPTDGCKGTGLRVQIGNLAFVAECAVCHSRYEQEEAEAARREQTEWLLARSGRTPLLDTWSFATYPSDAGAQKGRDLAMEWLARYLRTPRGKVPASLLLYGPTGTGKTGLAWSLVRALCEEQIEARFVHWPELLDSMRESYRRGDPTYKAMQAGRVQVLALDDLGAEKPTEWALEQLLLVLERRRQRLLATIVTSNFPPDELMKRLGHPDPVLGQRIVSRLIDGAVQIKLAGQDRRRAL